MKTHGVVTGDNSPIGAAIPLATGGATVSPDALQEHLRSLAGELGRETPSRGLDLAAGYVAEQWRRSGLEPAGDSGYFQTANFVRQIPSQTGAEVIGLSAVGRVRAAGPEQLGIGARCEGSSSGDGPAIVSSVSHLAELYPARTRGRVLVVTGADYPLSKSDVTSRLRELAPRLTVFSFGDGANPKTEAFRHAAK